MVDHNKDKDHGGHVNKPKSDRFYLGFIGMMLLFSGTSLAWQHWHARQEPLVHDISSGGLYGTSISTESMSRSQIVREQLLRHQERHSELPPIPENHPPYYMVFSTSCTDQMLWESYVLFYHAFKVKQPGSVTRIASGCSPEQAKDLQDFHKQHIASMRDDFYLHLTPDFSRGQDYIHTDKGAYKYMNKPYGLRHWMESVFAVNAPGGGGGGGGGDEDWNGNGPPLALQSNKEDGIVFLMDPDMILQRPMVHDFTNEPVLFAEPNPTHRIVSHGHPIAQQDGYLNNMWMSLNVSYITQGQGTLDHVTGKDGPTHWNTGPPYLATVRDMYNIAVRWTEYAPRIYDIHPKLFAEMYGQIFAATQLNLSHTLIQSLVVSEPTTQSREGWPYIDILPSEQVCQPSTQLQLDFPMPFGLHYCKRYMLNYWFFSKYRLKKKYISCETPLLQSPPIDLAMRGYKFGYGPPPNKFKGNLAEWDAPVQNWTKPNIPQREAFMLCGLIAAVNEAAVQFKRTACSDNPKTNWNSNYTFFNDPQDY
eukprot:Nitzschia sp. Nitz4//scaffold319_size20443//9812//11413//NITZ4_008671-RA/size20443-processed-gene-0.13-mRNA-1//-1//CDS//3329547580//5956//frame0